jgi:hypothetical protein
VDGFLGGFVDGGGTLPDGWSADAEALDLFSLVDLLARPDTPLFARVLDVVRARLAG